MKKIVYILLCCIFLCGCNAESESNTTTNESQTVSQETSGTSATQTAEEKDSVDTSEETSDSADTEKPVLNFTGATVDGETMTSDCFKASKLTMLNVWATYCNPCLNEMPYLGEIAAEYDASEFQIIGILSDVMEDSEEEDIAYAKELITQTQANYPHLLLGESLYQNLVGGVSAVPTTFFVTQDGEVLGYLQGALSKEQWKETIDGLLADMEK